MIPVVSELVSSGGELIVLIKPQYEAKREDVEEGGIVSDPDVHQEILERIKFGWSHPLIFPIFSVSGIEDEGFECIGIMPSPLRVSLTDESYDEFSGLGERF